MRGVVMVASDQAQEKIGVVQVILETVEDQINNAIRVKVKIT